MTSRSRWPRALFPVLAAILAVAVWAVAQSSQPVHAAAQKTTDFAISPSIIDEPNGFRLSYQTYNHGPDTAPFEVIAWYSVVVEFPPTLTPRDGDCHLVEYEDRGPYTVGVCTKHGPHHSDLPLGALGARTIEFYGTPTVCDTLTMSIRLDAALYDPTPVRRTLNFGLSDQCGR